MLKNDMQFRYIASFGLETHKAKPKLSFLKGSTILNDKIQYFYDEYAMLDWKQAIEKFKKES